MITIEKWWLKNVTTELNTERPEKMLWSIIKEWWTEISPDRLTYRVHLDFKTKDTLKGLDDKLVDVYINRVNIGKGFVKVKRHTGTQYNFFTIFLPKSEYDMNAFIKLGMHINHVGVDYDTNRD